MWKHVCGKSVGGQMFVEKLCGQLCGQVCGWIGMCKKIKLAKSWKRRAAKSQRTTLRTCCFKGSVIRTCAAETSVETVLAKQHVLRKHARQLLWKNNHCCGKLLWKNNRCCGNCCGKTTGVAETFAEIVVEKQPVLRKHVRKLLWNNNLCCGNMCGHCCGTQPVLCN